MQDIGLRQDVLIPVLLPILILPGCAGERSESGYTVRDSAGITIVENSDPQWTSGNEWHLSPEPTLDIGVRDGAREYQFFQMAGAVRMPDDRFAVADGGSGEVRFYDDSGRFQGATPGKGSGPGEFQDIFFFQKLPGDSLLAYDWRNRRVSVLTPAGEFARSFEFTVLTSTGGFPIVTQPFPDGDILLGTDMFATSQTVIEGAKRDSAIYYLLDPTGSVRETLGAFPGGESYQTTDGENWVGGGLVFGKAGHASVSGEGFYFGSSDRFEIEYRNKRGQLLRLQRLDRDNLPVTQADIDRYVSQRMERARPDRRRIYETMFEHMPYPATMPAFGEFMVDADRNLWVENYRKPGDGQPRWMVFDPGGVYLGTLDTPPGFQIFEIGSDYILGRWRDELDVEHLRMYELIKG